MTKMLKTFSFNKLLRRRKPSLSNNMFKILTCSNLKLKLKTKELMTYLLPKTWLSKPMPSSLEKSADGLRELLGMSPELLNVPGAP